MSVAHIPNRNGSIPSIPNLYMDTCGHISYVARRPDCRSAQEEPLAGVTRGLSSGKVICLSAPNAHIQKGGSANRRAARNRVSLYTVKELELKNGFHVLAS